MYNVTGQFNAYFTQSISYTSVMQISVIIRLRDTGAATSAFINTQTSI